MNDKRMKQNKILMTMYTKYCRYCKAVTKHKDGLCTLCRNWN